MNFYRRRPLALIISLCILVSAAGCFLHGITKLILLAVIPAAAPVVITVLRRHGVTDICNLAPMPFVIITAALMMSMTLTSFAYFDIYAARYESLAGGRIRATVVEVENRESFIAVYRVRLEEYNGENVNAKGVLSSDTALTLTVGDIIETDAEFQPLDKFYDYTDIPRLQMLSDGIVFGGSTVGSVTRVGSSECLEVQLARLRDAFSASMALYLDRDSSALAEALLLGQRGGLGRIQRDFNYIGVIHLLALSGLHLSVIGGGLEGVLKCFRVRRRVRYIAVTLFIIFYTALTGLLVTVIRAAVMLIIYYLASLFDTDSDGVTALFFAVGVIVLVDPTAVFDVSLQLSFAATLGIILLSDTARRYAAKRLSDGRSHPILEGLLGMAVNIAASLGATMFILPLQWLYFGEGSPMSVPATLIMSVLCEGMLILLPPLLICSLIGWSTACGILGGTVCILSELCASTAETLAEHSVLVSLRYPFALPIILITAAVIVWMIIRNFPSWLYALIPFAAASVIYFGCVCAYDAVYAERVTLDLASDGANDVITLVSRRSAMIVDIGEGSATMMYLARNALSKRYLTEIDTLMLTDIHRRHTSSVRTLLKNRRVRRILIPSPTDEYEMYIVSDIIAAAGEYGAKTVLYDLSHGADVIHGDVRAAMCQRYTLSRSTRPLKALTFAYEGTTTAYVGASVWEHNEAWSFVDGAKYMIFGSVGPIAKVSVEQVVKESTEVVWIADEGLAEFIVPWLDGFDGTLFVENDVSMVIQP